MRAVLTGGLLLSLAACGGSVSSSGDADAGLTESGTTDAAEVTVESGLGQADDVVASPLQSLTDCMAPVEGPFLDGACTPDEAPGLPEGGSVPPGVRIPASHRPSGACCPVARAAGVLYCGVPGTCGPCQRDEDCTGGTNGRCLAGDNGPLGGCHVWCDYDQCFGDSDCPAKTPCACRTPGVDVYGNACLTGSNCRIDADCGPGGFCSPSEVLSSDPTNAQCGRLGRLYFCHTPGDACVDDSDCASGKLCGYDSGRGAWTCLRPCPPPP